MDFVLLYQNGDYLQFVFYWPNRLRQIFRDYKLEQFMFCAKPGDFYRIDFNHIVFKTVPAFEDWES